MSEITDFLLARIDEDEDRALALWDTAVCCRPLATGHRGPGRRPATCPGWLLSECVAKRRIIEFHRSWPVLVTRTDPMFETVDAAGLGLGFDQLTYRITSHTQWLEEQEYIRRFGTAAPTTPMIRALAQVYEDHPDYREEWRV